MCLLCEMVMLYTNLDTNLGFLYSEIKYCTVEYVKQIDLKQVWKT